MYVPKHFEEPRVEVMHALMRARPLATLITLSSTRLDANHIPLQLVEHSGAFGSLRGHVARANPVWKDFDKTVEVLCIFHGPDAYISPAWYATKKVSGKVVPTWNYAVVHAYGHLNIQDDATWLRSQLEALTTTNEATQTTPWKMSDAPRDYVENLMKAIVGFEIVITRLSGKWKMSQNQPEQNRTGVVAGLMAQGHSDAIELADLVRAGENQSG